eukprot:2498466-Rhodomonas_salina.1
MCSVRSALLGVRARRAGRACAAAAACSGTTAPPPSSAPNVASRQSSREVKRKPPQAWYKLYGRGGVSCLISEAQGATCRISSVPPPSLHTGAASR